jgi:hypothetical protein
MLNQSKKLQFLIDLFVASKKIDFFLPCNKYMGERRVHKRKATTPPSPHIQNPNLFLCFWTDFVLVLVLERCWRRGSKSNHIGKCSYWVFTKYVLGVKNRFLHLKIPKNRAEWKAKAFKKFWTPESETVKMASD